MPEKACVFPTSFAQRRLWFLTQLAPGSAFYNIHNALPLEFPVDAAVLERAFNEIVRRHESLRTTFELRGDEPVQVVADELRLRLRVEDLRPLSPAEQERESTRLAAEQACEAFDLARGPLLRVALLQLAPSRNVLLLTIHHITADAWSMSVLYRELAEIYQAFAAGLASPLPELPIQYADFAVWQSDWLQGEVLHQQMDFWRRQLDGASVLELPTDRPRPAVNTLRGASHRFRIRAGLVSRLKALSRDEDCTLFMTLLAAFFALLYRYTNQRDLLVGTPIANRNRTELEPLIGFFVNTLVVRVAADGELTFRQLMRRVRETTLEAYGHQDLPFEKLVEELQPVRDMSRNPIYQVTFQLHNAPAGEGATSGETGWVPQVHRGTSNFDLAFEVWHEGEGLSASLDYSTDLFDAATMTRLGTHYTRILEGIADDPGRGLTTLPILAADEKITITRDWNETDRRYPREACIHHLFAQIAEARPDAAALRFDGGKLSYGELDGAANRVARGLRRRGVRADQGVGICLQRSPETIIGIIGILKAGGAYVALDPDDPPARMAAMLKDAGCSILLTENLLAASFRSLPVEVLVLDGDDHPFADESPTRLGPEEDDACPQGLAYISFTSGSTGRPKGVGITHRGVVNLTRAVEYVEIGPDDAILQFAPIPFDASTFELWAPLVNGACVVIHPPVRPSLEELARFITSERLTVAFLTTGLFHQMVDAELESLTGLRCVLTGGDVLSAQHARELLSRPDAPTLINCYGPTECTMFVSCWIMDDPSQVDDSVSIGRSIANTRLYVLDPCGNPVPVGVAGELHVGGDGLARGYVGQPAVTAAAFIPDRLSEIPGGRLYRTGDRVRYRSDGRIEFLGRVDRQLKIRGYRIEPAATSRRPWAAIRRCARSRCSRVSTPPAAGSCVPTWWRTKRLRPPRASCAPSCSASCRISCCRHSSRSSNRSR